jgi:predicted AlkP superfamily phosphohydrolase/phosphomutase
MRGLALFVVSLLLISITPLAAKPGSPRVVLLSIDAGSDVILDRLLASGALKGGAFERMTKRGTVAASMAPAAVSSTPVSHPTMFSGAWPGTHGITGVGLPGEEIGSTLRVAFGVPTSVDRLWNVVERAGKRVVCIAAPGAEATTPENTCSETVPFNSIAPAAAADERITKKFGPSPGAPSGGIATTGQVTEEEYIAREERFADYISNAVRIELARDDWDLLITYIPLMDGLEHRYLLDDPRQAEYGEEHGARRKRFAQFIEAGYKKMDAIIASWLAAAPETNFIIVSDHGMVPTHSVVLVNNVLAAAGLRVGGADAQVRAISSGASVQVYVNSTRRFSHGVVSDEGIPAIMATVVDALRGLRDPLTQRQIFTTIAAGQQLGPLNLQHANAGDVYASAEPGWGVTSRFDPAVPHIVPSTLSPDVRARVSRSPAEQQFLEKGAHNELSIGVHGHRPGDPRIGAIFYAIGPDIPRKRVGRLEMIDVAPSVLQLLRIAQPSFMRGKSAIAAKRRE